MNYSIITINLNNGVGLEKTIKSVICQSYCDFEFIVIDGGSTDHSLDVIHKYSDSITYWISEPDKGIYNAMNKGVAKAHGDYCLFINSGDELYDENVLDVISKYGDTNDIIVGKTISKNSELLFLPPSRDITLYHLYSSTVPHQSSFIKTKLLRLFPYDETLKIVSDWKFFVQTIIVKECSVIFVDVVVAIFDMEGVSTTNPEKMWIEKESVLSKMYSSRLLADYKLMKASECLTQLLTPSLRKHYFIDRILYNIGKLLLKIVQV